MIEAIRWTTTQVNAGRPQRSRIHLANSGAEIGLCGISGAGRPDFDRSQFPIRKSDAHKVCLRCLREYVKS